MEFSIRKLRPSDFDDLIALWKACGLPHRALGRDSREAITNQMERRDTCFWGMFDRDRLIGSVIGDSNGRKGWINRLSVHPEYRGRGLSGTLIKKCETFFEDLGLHVMAALIEEHNDQSSAAFRKAGYLPADNIVYWFKRPSDNE